VFTLFQVMQPDEAAEFSVIIQRWQKDHPAAVLIVNLTHGTSMAAKARKIIIEGVNDVPYGVCFLNAGFGMRALVGLMLNATRLLGRSYPHTFVDTEAEAWAWARQGAGVWNT
jgi:hypothetical protein